MNHIVVGSGYGDEGKGLMTDYLVRQSNAKNVVRFNGGAQAGHTVQTDHHRYVFGHLSAGTFAGANTILTRDFLINPRALVKEIQDMEGIGSSCYPEIKAHRGCRVTTIFDIAINAVLEISRGSSAHGSCGMGINETVVRNDNPLLFGTRLYDVKQMSVKQLAEKLKTIHDKWVPIRLKEHGITISSLESMNDNFANILCKEINYIQEARLMLDALSEISYDDQAVLIGNTVFEGAQGLGLDEEFGHFPHVTRSKTGSVWAFDYMDDYFFGQYAGSLVYGRSDTFWLENVEVVYVTRAYATRHGNGPLSEAGGNIGDGSNVYDLTNKPNPFQGSLRFAPLNLQLLRDNIQKDIARTDRSLWKNGNAPQHTYQKVIALTCMDQLGNYVNVIDVNGIIRPVLSSDLPQMIEEQVGLRVKYISHGSKASDIKKIF